MSDEVHQLPGVLIVLVTLFTPRWHARQADAVLDDVVQLAVSQTLGIRLAHIGRLRIQVLADRRAPAAVVRMTDGAVIREMPTGVVEHVCTRRNRVFCISSASRNGETADAAGHELLDRRRLVTRAESSTDD